MEKKEIIEELEAPEGISVTISGTELRTKGKKGEVIKHFDNPRVKVAIKGNKVVFSSKTASKKDKTVIKTYVAHMKNAFKGSAEGYVYKLKICSGHFPMNVAIANKVLQIKNFLGEKVPREVRIREGVNVKIDGSFITVESEDKDLAGQTAADIEQATRRPGFDNRIFQDGIYLIEKAGKPI